MLKRPPQHAVDAIPQFIWEHDDAWDHDRIAKERKALTKDAVHPFDAYHAGETRYDLDAPLPIGGQHVKIETYLTGTPTVFELRRDLGSRRMQQYLSASVKDIRVALYDLARDGTVKISEDGDEWPLEGPPARLTDADMDLIYNTSGAQLQLDVGLAVMRTSRPLSVSEGKP